MKRARVFNLLALIFLTVHSSSAQVDTSRIRFPIGSDFEITGEYSDFGFRSSFYQTSNLFNEPSMIMLRTTMQLGLKSEDFFRSDIKLNVLNPLSQEYSAAQSMKPWEDILGTVQVGALGYLAYEHLKKYGFLKK